MGNVYDWASREYSDDERVLRLQLQLRMLAGAIDTDREEMALKRFYNVNV